MSDFYPAFSATCFVVLTLWLMTVQQRYHDWAGNGPMIRRAFGIGLYFSLPGIMTLISLVDPTSPLLWEWSYTLVALGGVVVMALLFTAGRDQLTTVAYPVAAVLYLAIGVIAIIGLNSHPAHVENHVDQVLLCVMLFLGVNVAWLLLFLPAPGAPGADATAEDADDQGGPMVMAVDLSVAGD
jgi:hypothetical protein